MVFYEMARGSLWISRLTYVNQLVKLILAVVQWKDLRCSPKTTFPSLAWDGEMGPGERNSSVSAAFDETCSNNVHHCTTRRAVKTVKRGEGKNKQTVTDAVILLTALQHFSYCWCCCYSAASSPLLKTVDGAESWILGNGDYVEQLGLN